MADATDLKSVGTSMRVRVPPRAFPESPEMQGETAFQETGTKKNSKKEPFFWRKTQ